MNTYWNCYKCEEENRYKTSVSNRVDFAMREGEELNLKCKKCRNQNELEVDDFYAKKSNLAIITAISLGLIGTPIMFYFFYYLVEELSPYHSLYAIGGYLLLPVTLYGMILKQDRERVSAFNRQKFRC